MWGGEEAHTGLSGDQPSLASPNIPISHQLLGGRAGSSLGIPSRLSDSLQGVVVVGGHVCVIDGEGMGT